MAADNFPGRKLGGYENENAPNGDGTARQIKKRMTWLVDGIQLAIDDVRADQEFLQDTANSQDYVTIVLTYASGAVYQGTGTIEGEIKFDPESSTSSINLGGPGTLSAQ